MTPTIQTTNSAGADLVAQEDYTLPAMGSVVVSTGYVYEIDRPALVKGRSGLAFKEDVIAFEGLIDADYRDEVKVKLFNLGMKTKKIKKGDRIAQLVILPAFLPLGFNRLRIVA